MAGSCDNVKLLLSCKVDELNSVSGNTDREVCILLFFRMLHSIDQFFFSEYVYVQVMCTLVKVSVENIYQIVYTFRFITSRENMNPVPPTWQEEPRIIRELDRNRDSRMNHSAEPEDTQLSARFTELR